MSLRSAMNGWLTIERVGLALVLAFQVGSWTYGHTAESTQLTSDLQAIQRWQASHDGPDGWLDRTYARKTELAVELRAIRERLDRIEVLLTRR